MNNFNEGIGAEIGQATQEIFGTMIFMDVEQLLDNQSEDSAASSNISSMIGLGGEIRGLLSIHFPEKVALGITSSFLGMDVESINEDVKDAVGEIANMVAGNLKIFFKDNNIQTELAIPTTVIGKSLRTSGLAGAERKQVFFQTADGVFAIELKYVLSVNVGS